MNQYKVEGQKFEKISEAKKAARNALIGKHEDSYVLVYEWESASPTIGDGLWNPVARAEYKRGKIICK